MSKGIFTDTRLETPDNPCLETKPIKQTGKMWNVTFQPESVVARLYATIKGFTEEFLAVEIHFRQFNIKSLREAGIHIVDEIKKVGDPYVKAIGGSQIVMHDVFLNTDVLTVIMGIKVEPNLKQSGIEYVALSELMDSYRGYFSVITPEDELQPYKSLSYRIMGIPHRKYGLKKHKIMLYTGGERERYTISNGNVVSLTSIGITPEDASP